jgi:hypothetical protein
MNHRFAPAAAPATGSYSPRAEPFGYAARNLAQGLAVRFSAAGVEVADGPARVTLRLRAVGYGDSLMHASSVPPKAAGGVVLYEHAGLSEWYRNGPRGLEQGFTFAHAPSGRDRQPLTLTLSLTGNVTASLAPGGHGLRLRGADGTTVRYSDLSARDASGRTLGVWLEHRRGLVLLRVADGGARYPVRIDPLVQQGEKLAGSTEIGEGGFGSSVALSADGNTALIGAPYDNNSVGGAYVFTRSGSTWTQQGEKLVAAGESGEGGFGSSVALSADGNTALIGAPYDSRDAGAAWVFTRSGSTWTQGNKLTGAGEVGEGDFGYAVALSADGSTALAGGPFDGKPGAAWAFARGQTGWVAQGAKLTGGGERGEGEFGASVALSEHGDTALIGGPFDNKVGAAWAFARSGSTWSQQAELTGTGESGEGAFGASVSLSGDGNTGLVGGPHDGAFKGAAWPFSRTGTTWAQQGEKLIGGEEMDTGYFGNGVSLSADGNSALIGGPYDSLAGAAWSFDRSGSTWSQRGFKLTGSGESGEGGFGYAVALSGDGSTGLIGGPFDGLPGAAWAFANAATPAVRTGSASSVAQHAATLNATVDPEGTEVSECRFQYGTSETYGSSVPCSTPPGSGSSPVAVSAPLAGLTPNSTYHFRIVATNAGGTSYGSDGTFKTLPNPPVVATEVASEAAPRSARLHATVDPEGGEVSECLFQYGTSEAYGSYASCSALPGSGTSPVAVSSTVAGLTPGNTYHFRILATNAGGTSYGSDATFKTPGELPAVTRVSPRKGHAAGGAAVTISGRNFVEVVAVRFGANAAPSFSVISPTSISTVSPAGVRGAVDVVVVTEVGASALTRKDRFKYTR